MPVLFIVVFTYGMCPVAYSGPSWVGGRGPESFLPPSPPLSIFCSPPPWFPHKKLFVVAVYELDNFGIGITWNKDEIEVQKAKHEGLFVHE